MMKNNDIEKQVELVNLIGKLSSVAAFIQILKEIWIPLFKQFMKPCVGSHCYGKLKYMTNLMY